MLILSSALMYGMEYKIDKVIVNQIDGQNNKLVDEHDEYYDTWNNFNDFMIMVYITTENPKKDYYEDNRTLLLEVYDKINGKKLYKEQVNTSYLNVGGQYQWFLIRNQIMSCGQYMIITKLLGQKKESKKEKIVSTLCGE